jgi:hypothetical protein
MIAGGRAWIRSVLYMSTIAAVRRNPILKECCGRLPAKGKPAKQAPTAPYVISLLSSTPCFTPNSVVCSKRGRIVARYRLTFSLPSAPPVHNQPAHLSQ